MDEGSEETTISELTRLIAPQRTNETTIHPYRVQSRNALQVPSLLLFGCNLESVHEVGDWVGEPFLQSDANIRRSEIEKN